MSHGLVVIRLALGSVDQLHRPQIGESAVERLSVAAEVGIRPIADAQHRIPHPPARRVGRVQPSQKPPPLSGGPPSPNVLVMISTSRQLRQVVDIASSMFDHLRSRRAAGQPRRELLGVAGL